MCERFQSPAHGSIIDALDRRFDLTTIVVDDRWPVSVADFPDHQRYDACVWFVRFRALARAPRFLWGGYGGLRIMYDLDAGQPHGRLNGARFLDQWPEVFRRHGFQVLVCGGRETRDHLAAAGVDAWWIPKAFDGERLFPLGRPRAGLCFYGERYPSRAAMLDRLRARGVPYTAFGCPPARLNEHLNRYLGCLVCNMEGQPAPGFGLLNSLLPSRFVRYRAGPETIIESFEAAAAGCVPFCDQLAEFEELGLKDGRNIVTYRTFDDLVDRIHHYTGRPELLRALGERAARDARAAHTWDHRAEQFERLIRERSR